MLYNYIAKTATKPTQDEEERQHRSNEDAIDLDLRSNGDRTITYAALSDGAGGTGAFCGQWANYLVDNCPDFPIKDMAALDAWITHIYQPFYKWCLAALVKKSFLNNKFYLEGSAATFVAFWLEETDEQTQLHLLSYGDSFYLLKQGDTYIFPEQRNSIEKYHQNPYLLNWKDEQSIPAGFSYRCQTLAKDAHFALLLCSDAVGQMLLSHYQKNDERIQTLSQTTLSFNTHLKQCLASPYTIMDILGQLIDSLLTRQSFETYMYQLHQQGYLEADDYSVAVFTPKEGAVE